MEQTVNNEEAAQARQGLRDRQDASALQASANPTYEELVLALRSQLADAQFQLTLALLRIEKLQGMQGTQTPELAALPLDE